MHATCGALATRRPDAVAVVRQLQGRGVRVLLASGDSPAAAAAVAREVGIPVSCRRQLDGWRSLDLLHSLQLTHGTRSAVPTSNALTCMLVARSKKCIKPTEQRRFCAEISGTTAPHELRCFQNLFCTIVILLTVVSQFLLAGNRGMGRSAARRQGRYRAASAGRRTYRGRGGRRRERCAGACCCRRGGGTAGWHGCCCTVCIRCAHGQPPRPAHRGARHWLSCITYISLIPACNDCESLMNSGSQMSGAFWSRRGT